MFSGIVDLAKIINIQNNKIIIENKYTDTQLGESIAINGVCLTVSYFDNKIIKFDISNETYSRTNFRYYKNGDFVNIERSLKIGSRLGGHIVLGHVDEIGKLIGVKRIINSYLVSIRVSDTKYIVEKGSVCVNGVSLTCFDITRNTFKVSIIPHTYENTNIKYIRKKPYLNIEFDIIGKYALKKQTIDMEFLKENGFLNK